MGEKVYILYSNFYTRDGSRLTIGGIQTYIYNLSQALIKIDKVPIIMQFADKSFENEYKNIKVLGVDVSKNYKNKRKILFNECMKLFDVEEDILIFASDDISVKNNLKNVISIQHGIFWDVQRHRGYGNIRNRLYFLNRTFEAFRTINRVSRSNLLVCVDYNFQNWYRTQLAYPEVKTVVIPNASSIPKFRKPLSNKREVSIIFARRFFEYRGTRIFAKAIETILNEFSNVQITFAGEGPDENYLKDKFSKDNRVQFIKYTSSESLEIHSAFDIAVIPTTGSEGTSLSLLEAMAAGCAVIATDVGGLTDILINGFNGIVISPDERPLYQALKELIDNETLRNKLSLNGYQTVRESFNLDLWEKSWQELILSLDQLLDYGCSNE